MHPGYDATIQLLKSQFAYLPSKPSKKFISQLATSQKQAINASIPRELTPVALEQKFINSRKIHAALLSDVQFSLRVPDEFTEGLRGFLLSIINGLSGGELEQYIKATMIYLLSG